MQSAPTLKKKGMMNFHVGLTDSDWYIMKKMGAGKTAQGLRTLVGLTEDLS